ncbi:hypothetical protein LIER_24540 [Lithospermum erythrorhizon]|uniref:Retrotransposon gag domain-containing protein n=1 Tax=Lithospermum erythrorhizon TaxID=34254 RepID=A0AAV3R5H8_LITER
MHMQGHTSIIAEFNKLSQTSSVAEYIDKLEDLRGLMICLGRNYDEVYFVSSFISGLKEELQVFVKVFKPLNLSHTYDLALSSEKQILAISSKLKPNHFPYKSPNSASPTTPILSPSFKPLYPTTPPLTSQIPFPYNRAIPPPALTRKLLTPAQIYVIIVMKFIPLVINAKSELSI